MLVLDAVAPQEEQAEAGAASGEVPRQRLRPRLPKIVAVQVQLLQLVAAGGEVPRQRLRPRLPKIVVFQGQLLQLVAAGGEVPPQRLRAHAVNAIGGHVQFPQQAASGSEVPPNHPRSLWSNAALDQSQLLQKRAGSGNALAQLCGAAGTKPALPELQQGEGRQGPQRRHAWRHFPYFPEPQSLQQGAGSMWVATCVHVHKWHAVGRLLQNTCKPHATYVEIS